MISIGVKVQIFWEGHKILRNLHLTFDYSQKVRWRFHKILWPSQNIWTLMYLAKIRSQYVPPALMFEEFYHEHFCYLWHAKVPNLDRKIAVKIHDYDIYNCKCLMSNGVNNFWNSHLNYFSLLFAIYFLNFQSLKIMQ